MEKTGKVTGVAGNGHYDGQYGRMYRFEITFDNGDYGQYLSKSQDQTKFVIGQDATYTKESKEHNGNTYYTIKPAQTQGYSGGGGGSYKKDPETEKRIARMSVLKAASDLCIAGKIELHSITYVSQILERYVMTGEDAMASVYQAAQNKKQEQKSQTPNPAKTEGGIMGNFREDAINDMVSQKEDDLPF